MGYADLEILEDPDYPEGGHVLLRFRGVDSPPANARFMIEPIDDSISPEWPVDLREPVEVRVTPEGLEIVAGPEIGNTIPEGVAVSVSVPGAGLSAERLWPSITPMVSATATRRVGRPKRPVAPVPPVAPKRAVETPAPKKPEEKPAEPTVHAAPMGPEPQPTLVPAAEPVATPAVEALAPAPPKEEPQPDKAAQSALARKLPFALPKINWTTAPGFALSFVLGAALVAGYSALGGRFPWTKPTVVRADSRFSLYDFLSVAPSSPHGTSAQSVPSEQWSTLLREQWDGKGAPKDSAEAAYWLKQLVVNGITPNQVKALTALGYLQARDSRDAKVPESARLMWEMAATRGGCAALLNLGYLQENDPNVAPGERREGALRWYRRAADVRCDRADQAINRVSR